jgi:hypothetical protein
MVLPLIELEEIGKNPCGWANLEQGFTGQFVRQIMTPLVGKPHHSNTWGALIGTAIKRRIVTPTSTYWAMQAVNSHGRKTPAYRWA